MKGITNPSPIPGRVKWNLPQRLFLLTGADPRSPLCPRVRPGQEGCPVGDAAVAGLPCPSGWEAASSRYAKNRRLC